MGRIPRPAGADPKPPAPGSRPGQAGSQQQPEIRANLLTEAHLDQLLGKLRPVLEENLNPGKSIDTLMGYVEDVIQEWAEDNRLGEWEEK